MKKDYRKYPVKIGAFSGASAHDMHHNLRPDLQKCPNAIILHVGANNCVNETSCVVPDKILNLKTFIQNFLLQCKIIIFSVMNKTDDASLRVVLK